MVNRKVIFAVLKVFMLFWPIFVFLAVKSGQLRLLLWFTLASLILRICTTFISPSLHKVKEIFPSIGMVLLLVVALVLNQDELVLYYPVLMNASLLLIFASTLLKGKPIIQQLAEVNRKGIPLPKEAMSYTRNLTKIWCVFFLLNGSVALWTCLKGDLNLWTLYNGCISYCLIALLFGVEYLYRKLVIHE